MISAVADRAGAAAPTEGADRFILAANRILAASAAYLVASSGLRLSKEIWPGISIGGLAHLTKSSIFDFLLVVGLMAAFLAVAYLGRDRPNFAKRLATLFFAIGIVLVWLTCIHVQALSIIGGPLTFQWLYYADFFTSHTSQFAVRSAINRPFLINVAAASMTYVLVYVAFARALGLAREIGRLKPLLATSALLGAAYVAFAFLTGPVAPGRERHAVNPLVEVVSTAIQGDTSDLLRLADAIPPARLPPPTHDRSSLPAGLAAGKARNVVLIILESVGANHVPGTGGAQTDALMPNLARYRERTLAFPNAYAHVAYSTKSLFSLLTGRVPLFSIAIDTHAFRDSPLVTLSSRLKAIDYRTAFFMSGDLEFHAADRFLAGRGFDRLEDIETIACSGGVYRGSTAEWPNLDLIDDRCTAQAVIKWAERPSRQPFFAMFWTGNTHWPYFSRPEPKAGQYSNHPSRNRYLAALRATDSALGLLLDHFDRTGILDETVVLIVGDHGEAFGERGFSTHGNTLFEEEMRVPLLILGGGAAGGTSTALGALSDVAPTILHLIGAPPEPSWDGRSLFDPNRPRRVMLYSTNEELAVGFREGSRKYSYLITRSQPFVFELADDPGETRNIADENSADYVRRHVAGWMQEQKRRLRPFER